MANTYCSIVQLGAFYDERTLGMLSNDANSREANTTKLQTLLDAAASEIDMVLMTASYTVPAFPVPGILTKLTAVLAAKMLFARRTDSPQSLSGDVQWAESVMDKVRTWRLSLPGLTHGAAPALISSEYLDGRSRFDRLPWLDGPPSLTGTSKGQ